ncbi:tail fiber protein [Chitinophaga solisilvae]|uniref:Uncharacterized protein n=1 Tax=Chitinophaga solisilvae TaxID=1233460 RepID=A0A433WFW6_9BACT|nr:tail fiber protein [Chitinophaga solisilvae]NSL90131.1 hypothetical protein [Chitinophaga solisilvae]
MRKKSVFYLSCLLLTLFVSSKQLSAQIKGSLYAVNKPGLNWAKVGTLTLPQGGAEAHIQFYGGAGYNAELAQMGYTEMTIRTSNGASVVNGFGFSAFASRTGTGSFITAIRIMPNQAGVAATTYDIYIYMVGYVGMSIYQITTVDGQFTKAEVIATPPAGAFEVPFEYKTQNDTYLANTLFASYANGNVGIGTVNPQTKLAVNGEISAKKVKVTTAAASWPDYVFSKDYKLPSIPEMESYILQHRHLAEIPSASEVAANGQDLGDINKRLLQKIEELSLYIIQLDKKNKELETRLSKMEAKEK